MDNVLAFKDTITHGGINMKREDSGITPSWNPWGGWLGSLSKIGGPTIDLYENEKEVVVEADLPGFDPNNITVSVSSRSMTMSGKTRSSKERTENGYYVRERGSGQFSRTVSFPTVVLTDEAKARYKDGVLRVSIPKIAPGEGHSLNVPIERE